MHGSIVTRNDRIVTIGRIRPEIQTELIRKSIHVLIAAVPTLSRAVGAPIALLLLATGTLSYAYAEHMRRHGITIPIITRITELASRKRDLNRFVLGPVTLGLGAMLALMLYPAPAASVAIYALAFGDGFASLVGKSIGQIRIPATGGKTIEGSMACFTAVAIAASFHFPAPAVIIIAATAMIIEMLPSGDADNLLLPSGVGMVATAFYAHLF